MFTVNVVDLNLMENQQKSSDIKHTHVILCKNIIGHLFFVSKLPVHVLGNIKLLGNYQNIDLSV